MSTPKTCTFDEFAALYCATQDCTPEKLRLVLQSQKVQFNPTGWLLHQAQLFDSSWFGQHVVIPYGPRNTIKEPPTHPFSPRGLASDTGVVVALLPAREVQL